MSFKINHKGFGSCDFFWSVISQIGYNSQIYETFVVLFVLLASTIQKVLQYPTRFSGSNCRTDF